MELNHLTEIAIKTSLLAGAEILKIYNDPESDFNIQSKADNSPLTIADQKSNDVIVKDLIGTGIAILSEEEKEVPYSERSANKNLWIVDPLDGTKEFIKRNGEFTVNVALVENGTPVIGVVYVPVSNTLYFANKEIGSFKIDGETLLSSSFFLDNNRNGLLSFISNAEKLPLSSLSKNDNEITVVASRSHNNEETEKYISDLKTKYKDVIIVSSGSSIKICLVAEGIADVYPRFAPTMEWDTAAGHAVALYAGKQVLMTDEKTSLYYNKENLLNPYFIVK